MTAITASLVKELRERTGSGMMECKQALVENNGDLELAVEAMRKSGLAKADKKSSRIAAEGTVAIAISNDKKSAVMVEVNCETDFVAKGDTFQGFADDIASLCLKSKPTDLEALLSLDLNGEDIEKNRVALISKIGENISVRRFERLETNGSIYAYKHGLKIGVLVAAKDANDELGKDLAMHIAASKPLEVSVEDIRPEIIAKEREIFMAQALESGKPENIVEKMVEGMVKKFTREISLLEQPFVKNPDSSVGQLLKENQASVQSFEMMTVGEGIEKKTVDFADEVNSQVAAAKQSR